MPVVVDTRVTTNVLRVPPDLSYLSPRSQLEIQKNNLENELNNNLQLRHAELTLKLLDVGIDNIDSLETSRHKLGEVQAEFEDVKRRLDGTQLSADVCHASGGSQCRSGISVYQFMADNPKTSHGLLCLASI